MATGQRLAAGALRLHSRTKVAAPGVFRGGNSEGRVARGMRVVETTDLAFTGIYAGAVEGSAPTSS